MEEKNRVGDITLGDPVWSVGPNFEPELNKCFDIEDGEDYRKIYIENADDERDKKVVVADLKEGLDSVEIPGGGMSFYIHRKDCITNCLEILNKNIESCKSEIDRYTETMKKLEGE